jgi:hypothetical protein
VDDSVWGLSGKAEADAPSTEASWYLDSIMAMSSRESQFATRRRRKSKDVEATLARKGEKRKSICH